MPRLQAAQIEKIAADLLAGAGAPPAEAAIVAKHSVEANLTGHDSHGIIQIPNYINRVEQGHIVPGAPIDIVSDTPTTTVVDGNWGFGYVVTEEAMKRTIAKAEQQNVAAATVYRQGHVGRVADYPLMAVEHGMIGLMTADSGRSPKAVAPFGGRLARLGTNPISIAVPSDLEGPLYFDMSTAAVAAGKIKLAEARGQQVPAGWIIDAEGHSTTDPAALSQGGALMPLGGDVGFKGYALATMVEILSALLTGLGFGVEPTGRHNDGCFIAVFKVDAFRDLATFKREVADFAQYLKETPTADGFNEVLYPGEIEHMRRTERLRDGVDVEDATWAKLIALGEKYGVSVTA
ncbi:Ldh family oxidoreductase [bacterium]|jgi:LDH2 family malate/lactate/ureidoglycolate dehydrogenase|nr:Ldh family oxidoreductase [bacterium]